MTPPVESLASLSLGDPMFALDAEGQPIARERSCECGRRFSQRLLSERFLSLVEARGKRAMELFQKQVPGLFVPVHCLPCERRDLSYGSRIADALAANGREDPRDIFGGRDAAD
jgi:hypothetical protein